MMTIFFSGKQQRQSVPQSMSTKNIRHFLRDLMKSSESWRAMKLVVLGNGQIGKTTMLHTLKQLIQTLHDPVCCFEFLLCFVFVFVFFLNSKQGNNARSKIMSCSPPPLPSSSSTGFIFLFCRSP